MTSLARHTDPTTSHEAAEQTQRKLNETQEQALSVTDYQRHLTAMEIAATAFHRHAGNIETYRKRVHELVRLGKLERRGVRKCGITGRNATVYARPRPQ